MWNRPPVSRRSLLVDTALLGLVGGLSALVLSGTFGNGPAFAAWSRPDPPGPAAEPPASEPSATDWSWRNRDPIDPAAYHRREADRRRRAEAGSLRVLRAPAGAAFPVAPAAAEGAEPAPAANAPPDDGAAEPAPEADPPPQVPPPRGVSWPPGVAGPAAVEGDAGRVRGPASPPRAAFPPPQELPSPRATLPPPLEPLPQAEREEIREALFETLREKAGEVRLWRIRPVRGTRVVFWDCTKPYYALEEEGDGSGRTFKIGEEDRPRAYALAEQHLDLAGVLLASEDREVRESGLGVVMATLMCVRLYLDDGPLQADVAEVFLVPHLDSASPDRSYVLSRRHLVGDAASAFKAGGRWERWGRACADWIRLTPNNRNQSDVMRISLYEALRNQGRIKEAVDVLYDVHDLVPLRDYHLNDLFGAEDPDHGPRVPEVTSETVGDYRGHAWPVPQAAAPPPLEPLPDREVSRLKSAIAATLRERAGEYRAVPIRPVPGRDASEAFAYHVPRLWAYQDGSRPAEEYALLEQHLAWAGTLLDADDRETRALGLGVIEGVMSHAGSELGDGALAADVAEAHLLPELEHASENPQSVRSRESLVGAAAAAFERAGRWERWERACGEAIRLNPNNRNQSDAWRVKLYQALRNQGRIKEGVDVLYDIYDLVPLREYRLQELFGEAPASPDGAAPDPGEPGEPTDAAAE